MSTALLGDAPKENAPCTGPIVSVQAEECVSDAILKGCPRITHDPCGSRL